MYVWHKQRGEGLKASRWWRQADTATARCPPPPPPRQRGLCCRGSAEVVPPTHRGRQRGMVRARC